MPAKTPPSSTATVPKSFRLPITLLAAVDAKAAALGQDRTAFVVAALEKACGIRRDDTSTTTKLTAAAARAMDRQAKLNAAKAAKR